MNNFQTLAAGVVFCISVTAFPYHDNYGILNLRLCSVEEDPLISKSGKELQNKEQKFATAASRFLELNFCCLC